MGGAGEAVFVALAYDLTGSCAGTAPDDDEVVPVADFGALEALSVFWALWEIALVIRRVGDG